MIRQQAGPQLRGRPAHSLQQVRRSLQPLRRQQAADLPGQAAVQGARRRHQHRLAARRIPEAVATVPEGGQFRSAPANTDPHRQQPAADAVPCRRPEHHRHHQIGRGGRDQQDLGVHIRIEDAVYRRDPAARQQPQGQNASRQGAGNGEQQQNQPQELFLPAESQQRQQDARRQLGRRGGQEPAARQEHRHGIGPAGQGRQQIASPPERQPRQPGRDQKKQIIHGRVQHKHAVHVDHRHGRPSFRQRSPL